MKTKPCPVYGRTMAEEFWTEGKAAKRSRM